MTRHQQIQQIIENWEMRQIFIWLIDITDEEEVVGQPGYLPIIFPKKIRQLACKIGCSGRYRGEKKWRKATRRFIKVLSQYPNLLDATLTEVFTNYAD